jgi:hypothetical protein
MAKTSCDICEQLKNDTFLNCRNGMIVCDECIEARQDADEKSDNGRNTGGKSYR